MEEFKTKTHEEKERLRENFPWLSEVADGSQPEKKKRKGRADKGKPRGPYKTKKKQEEKTEQPTEQPTTSGQSDTLKYSRKHECKG